MTKAYASTVLDAHADAVWEIVGDFDGLPAWSSRIASSRLEGGSGRGAVGSTRHLTRVDGGQIVERLLSYDDVARRLSYEFVGAVPFAVRTYRAWLTVAPVTDGGGAFVEWFGEFDADAADEPALQAQFGEIFTSGLARLRDVLRSRTDITSSS